MTLHSRPQDTTALLDREALAVSHLCDSLRAFDDPDLLIDMIEGETDFLECVDRLLDAMTEDEALATGAEDIARKLAERSRAAKRRNEARKSALEGAMLSSGLKQTLRRPAATLALRRNPPSLGVVEEADIPSQFFLPQPPKLDRRGLLATLKDGAAVPGACLQAPSMSLQIRRG